MDEYRVLSLLSPPVPDPSDWHLFCADMVGRIMQRTSSEVSRDPNHLVSLLSSLLGISVSSARSFLTEPASLSSEMKRYGRQMLIALAYNMEHPSGTDQVIAASKILEAAVGTNFPGDDDGVSVFGEVPECFSDVVAAAATGAIGSRTTTASSGITNSRRVPAETSTQQPEHSALADSCSLWEKAYKHIQDVKNLAEETEFSSSSKPLDDNSSEKASKRQHTDPLEPDVAALVSAAESFCHVLADEDCADKLDVLSKQRIEAIDCNTLNKLTDAISTAADIEEYCFAMNNVLLQSSEPSQ